MKSLCAVVVLVLASQAFAGSPRRYIVEFTPAMRGRVQQELRGERRFHVRREFSRVLNGAAIELADEASIEEIAQLPYVARVTPDAIVTAYGTSTDVSRATTTRPRTNAGEASSSRCSTRASIATSRARGKGHRRL
jgi:hypothetical protein